MPEKKQLNEEQLNKVAGGTYVPEEGYVFYTMEEIRKLTPGQRVSYFKISATGYIEPMGRAEFIRAYSNGTAVFHYGRDFTVGDNDEYFVGPLDQENAVME